MVLVTGATGFIGRHVVRALRARGDDVLALARGDAAGLDARVVRGDLGDPASLRAAVAGASAVIHLASLLKVPWKPEFRSLNVEGTRALAEACAARAIPLVLVSSLAAGGPSPADAPRREDDPARPVSRYGRMKLDCEEVARRAGGRVVVVRPPMVLGDGDRWALGLFRSVARGVHLVPTWRDHRVSLIHAADLARALVAALAADGLYYVASDEQPTYAELGLWIAEALGVARPRLLRVPSVVTGLVAGTSQLVGRLRDRPTILNLDKWREARAGSWICDAARAKRDLGLACPPARQRLAETAAAYRAAGWL